jgi:hypothetical protein
MTSAEAESMVTQMKTILDQYAVKIRALEVENAVLREEIRKAGIQIPLSAFSGVTAITTAPTTTTPTSTGTTAVTSTGTAVVSTGT